MIAARDILGDRAGLLEALDKSRIESPDLGATLESSSRISDELENEGDAAASMPQLIERVELRDDGIRLTLKIQVPCSRAGVRATGILNLSRFVPLRMKRRGVETKIVIGAGDQSPRRVDAAQLKAMARSRAWFDELASGQVRSLADIARREKVTRRYVERLARLAFIAPAIVEAIAQGRQPAELSTETLLDRIDLPRYWSEQRNALGIG